VWNIDGRLTKLQDPNFVRYVDRFTCVCVCETFVQSFDFSHCFSSFDTFIVPARKLARRDRMSGGLICLIKKNVSRMCQRVEGVFNNIFVLRVDKTLFGSMRDVLVFFTYVPPIGSPFYEYINHPDGIYLLERCMVEVTNIHDECDILLCGDLNAGTSNFNTDDADNLFNARLEVLVDSRFSHDDVVNEYGRSLLSLCAAFELSILNGCLSKDKSGIFTYVSHTGSSVIDYCIVSKDFILVCQSLSVTESIVSPHMCLELNIRCCVSYDRNIPLMLSTKVVWNDDLVNKYL